MKNSAKPSPIKDLVLLFSIPIAIALIAAAVIYIPQLLANPKYDFVYSQCNDYGCGNSYIVNESGMITEKPTDASRPSYRSEASTLYYYDAAEDAIRRLTIEEAQNYRLSTSSKSPDGYSLSKDSRQDGFLFWGGGSESWALKDGAKKKKIELYNDGSYYTNDITFLGWVEK